MTEETEPVKVYCRLKPLFDENQEPCVFYETKGHMEYLRTVPPNGSRRNAKEATHMFSEIFTEEKGQNEIFENVAYPMVLDILDGKNGLLFTYGVTGSGKTFTMQGTEEEPGIVPRALKSLFRRIKLVPQNRVKSDNRNGFIIRGLMDEAMSTCSDPKKFLSNRASEILSNSYLEKIEDIELDDVKLENCAVFISLVEIYGKRIIDLLAPKSDPPKDIAIKDDVKKNKYLHNVLEVEVQSPEEAFSLYLKGQMNRKVESTKLNNESSRSHMVFNIRLVRLDGRLSHLSTFKDTDRMWTSQLSLIDLAGSERANRSGTVGARLKEAGDINNSLMVLRRCMELLRDKNRGGASKPDYRSSELTHLFKTTLEGGSALRMIVCVQPSSEEYDETMNVLMFADNSQEVSIPVQRAAEPFKQLASKSEWSPEDRMLNRLREISDFVSKRRMQGGSASTLEEIQVVLQLHEMAEEAAEILAEVSSSLCQEEEDDGAKERAEARLARERVVVTQLRLQQSEERAKFAEVESRLAKAEERARALERQLEQKQLHDSIRANQAVPKTQVKAIVKKFEQSAQCTVVSQRNVRKAFPPMTVPASNARKGFFNPRFRKSRSQEHYIVHKEKNEIPTGTLHQVPTRGKKETHNPSMEDLRRHDQYLLQHQTVDGDANLQTHYYKGNIIPTATEGSSVMLYEVETVCQRGPLTGKRSVHRRSLSDGDYGDSDGEGSRKRLKDDSD